jgi:hypothetical protein
MLPMELRTDILPAGGDQNISFHIQNGDPDLCKMKKIIHHGLYRVDIDNIHQFRGFKPGFPQICFTLIFDEFDHIYMRSSLDLHIRSLQTQTRIFQMRWVQASPQHLMPPKKNCNGYLSRLFISGAGKP